MKKLKYGILGAAPNAFIGNVHIRAIEATHKAELVAGFFSIVEEERAQAAAANGVDPSRSYDSPEEMCEAESKKTGDDRLDFVVITTPNNVHYKIAKMFLEAGFNVSCEKPVTFTEEEAIDLKRIADEKGVKMCVTFTYSGYPALRHARKLIRNGEIGDIVMAAGEYVQGWLAGDTGMPPWRTDPKIAGRMNSLADIGSHAQFTIQFLTGMKLTEACCQLDNFGGFKTDTNACVIEKFDNGATGTIWSSQVAFGNDNEIRVRIYGTKGAIEWENICAEKFILTKEGYPQMIVSKGNGYSAMDQLSSAGRLPAGHHEGLYYAFCNIYDNFLLDIMGEKCEVYPTIDDGIEIMHWLETCWTAAQNHTWAKA